MNLPWLSQAEIDDLCAPLTKPSAQIRYMLGLGLTVKTKPNGRALVLRRNVEDVLAPTPGAKKEIKREPNRAALIALHGGSV